MLPLLQFKEMVVKALAVVHERTVPQHVESRSAVKTRRATLLPPQMWKSVVGHNVSMKVAAEGDDWETDPDFEVGHTSSAVSPGHRCSLTQRPAFFPHALCCRMTFQSRSRGGGPRPSRARDTRRPSGEGHVSGGEPFFLRMEANGKRKKNAGQSVCTLSQQEGEVRAEWLSVTECALIWEMYTK